MTAPRKAPCVDVRTDVHKDVRFEVLGELAGYNRYEALGRMHALWSWCVDRGLQDAPDDSDGYVVSDAVVRRFLGPNGIAAIMGDGCDEFALGERREDGRVYLRGTSEYVAERRARVATSSAGGQARASGNRDRGGRFVPDPTIVQPEPSREPAGPPAASQPTPASSSSSSPSGSQNSLAPRAIPPSTAYELARLVWQTVSAARVQLAAELAIPNVIALPDRFGAPSEPKACRELRDRVREEGDEAEAVCRHVVENLIAQAREENTVDWLSEKAFTEGGWRTARSWVPGQGGRARKRAGPRGSPTYGASKPRTEHPETPVMRPASEVL